MSELSSFKGQIAEYDSLSLERMLSHEKVTRDMFADHLRTADEKIRAISEELNARDEEDAYNDNH